MATKVTDLFDNDWKRYRAIADVTGGIALKLLKRRSSSIC